MRVVLVNAVEAVGGAARAAHRLYTSLQPHDLDVSYFVKEKHSDDPCVIPFNPDFSSAAVARRGTAIQQVLDAYEEYAGTRSDDLELFSHPALDQDMSFLEQLPDADIYNLHWVAGFVEYPVFFTKMAQKRPLVWTLHDQGPMTGGCHYDQGCGRFTDACGSCPALGSHDANDLSARNLAVKAKALATWPDHMVHIVTPSNWLAAEARRSSLFGRFQASCIPNSIETELFCPRPAVEARCALGLPEAGPYLLFVANQIKAPRKGVSYLIDALRQLPGREDVTLLCVGDDHIPIQNLPFRMAQLDFVGDDEAMAHLYAAADLTVIPSLQDNLPNTMLESLSCGTPVVGFDTGGLPDGVRPGETGFLAQSGSAESLMQAIGQALGNPGLLEQMGQNARAFTVANYAPARQAVAYKNLFTDMAERAKT